MKRKKPDNKEKTFTILEDAMEEMMTKPNESEHQKRLGMAKLIEFVKHNEENATRLSEMILNSFQSLLPSTSTTTTATTEDTSVKRLALLRIIDFFVRRSSVFRGSVINGKLLSDYLLPFCCETRANDNKKQSFICSKALIKESREKIQSWNEEFGSFYVQLGIALDVLNSNPSKTLLTSEVEESVLLNISERTILDVGNQIPSLLESVKENITQIDHFFELIIPNVGNEIAGNSIMTQEKAGKQQEKQQQEQEEKQQQEEKEIPGLLSGEFEITLEIPIGQSLIEERSKDADEQTPQVMELLREYGKVAIKHQFPKLLDLKSKLTGIILTGGRIELINKHKELLATLEALISDLKIRIDQLKDLKISF